MISNILSVGNKVDIKVLKQNERGEKKEGQERVFRSQIYDISEHDIKMAMPIERGKIILLPLGVQYEFCVYTKQGLYRCEGEIRKRYKSNNIYMVSVAIKSELTKYQRREFYRLPCLVDVTYQNSDEEIEGLDAERIVQNIDQCIKASRVFKGIIIDISGGGFKFSSDNQLKKDSYVCFSFKLELSNQIKDFKVVGKIISSERIETERGPKYENRVQFKHLNKLDQEAIVRYIFETERKKVNRKKD